MNIENTVMLRDLVWKSRYMVAKGKRSNDGLVKHPMYSTWIRMIDRCYNPNSPNFRPVWS